MSITLQLALKARYLISSSIQFLLSAIWIEPLVVKATVIENCKVKCIFFTLQVLCMAPPYDKSPEWEKLTGHSAEVRACCIGNRESGHPLIATASDDTTVQLWDTRNMPSPKIVKLPVSLPHYVWNL